MIGYYIPHSVYPSGYHCDPKMPVPYLNLASQKSHMALYMMGIYLDEEEAKWFTSEWAKTAKKLDAGKSCIRFKKLDDLALDVIGKAIKRMPAKKYLGLMEANIAKSAKAKKKK